eukprot:14886536-Alexandrium_andersonii.AAC.2
MKRAPSSDIAALSQTQQCPASMSAPSSPDDGEPTFVMTRFKPTLPCQETRDIIANLPSDFWERYARQIECHPHELQVLAARELPDCGSAHEYMIFQNGLIQSHGPNNAAPPMLTAQSAWTHADMAQCIESIVPYGKPEPPRFVALAYKK